MLISNRQSLKWGLCLGWIVLVSGWAVWEATHYSGLYRWLAEWQLTRFGRYALFWTAFGPVVLLAGPALSWMGKVGRRRHLAELAGGDHCARLLWLDPTTARPIHTSR